MKHKETEKGLSRIGEARAGDMPPAPLARPTPLTERYLYDPYGLVADFDRQFQELRRNMETMLLPTWNTIATRPLEAVTAPRFARADFRDTGKAFEVELEVPGFEREDIDIELMPGEVRVEARRREEKREGKKGERYFAHERSYASLRRSFTFPEEVLPDEAEAKLENGVLKLTLPKRVATPPPKSVKLKVA
jgi:HSP20 family protein